MTIASLQEARSGGLGLRLTSTKLVQVDVGGGVSVGVVRTSPAQLASMAGLTKDEYTLARVVVSEGYGGAAIGRAAAAVAIAQATRNGARASGLSITDKLTRSVYPETAGLYGNQKGKYASTAADPYAWHARVVRDVLADRVPDLVGGAANYLDPAVWGKRGKDDEFERVVTSWHKDRAWIGPVPTIDSYHLMVFAKEANAAKRAASLSAVLAVYRRGKAGKSEPAPGDPDKSFPFLPTLALLALAGLVLL